MLCPKPLDFGRRCRRIDPLAEGILYGADDEMRVGDKHVGAEFAIAGGEIVGQLAGKVGLSDDVEFRARSITSFKIGHSMRCLRLRELIALLLFFSSLIACINDR